MDFSQAFSFNSMSLGNLDVLGWLQISLVFFGMLFFVIWTIRAALGAPFVPTSMRAGEMMLEAANKQKKMTSSTKLYDLGCGDGRLIFSASKKYGAQTTGFELSPIVYVIAQIRKILTGGKGTVKLKNFEHQSLEDADIITCFLMPSTLKKISKKLEKELKKGTIVVSYAFPITDWKPIETIPRNKKFSIAPIRIYEIGKQ
jgi:SAM-dependent methyltransferase